MTRFVRAGVVAGVLSFAAHVPVTGQDADFVWDNATEFSYVQTAGNASSNTLGLKSALTGTGGPNSFKVEVGGIRSSSTQTDRSATGTTTSFVITETTRTEQSAENYFAKGRYDRDVGVAFAFGGAGWERNTFAGFNHRVSIVAGVGKTWVEGGPGLFKTDIGATYTVQKDIEDDPTRNDGFGGLRATIEATRALTSTTDLASTIVVDERIHLRKDVRFDWVTSVAVALTEGLAFKTSYQMLFDNDPALIGVPLLDAGGNSIGQVRTPSDKVDSFITLSLVIKL